MRQKNTIYMRVYANYQNYEFFQIFIYIYLHLQGVVWRFYTHLSDNIYYLTCKRTSLKCVLFGSRRRAATVDKY